jgi:hypothetical protein
MINPWQPLFDAWLNQLSGEKHEMKKYEVTLVTHAKTTVFVDANDEDEAVDMAFDYLNENDIELGEWEVENVERGTE